MQGQSNAPRGDAAPRLELPLRAVPALLAAAEQPAQFPPDLGREVAFAGRSNAGKSSAINALTGLGGLSRVSKTPGRTRALLFFALPGGRRLVDLPGYGYAAVSRRQSARWPALIEDYLRRRASLAGIFLLSDIRHPLTALDRDFLALAREAGRPCHLLLAKADKLTRGAALAIRERTLQALAERGGVEGATVFSARSGLGLAEARRRLLAWLH